MIHAYVYIYIHTLTCTEDSKFAAATWKSEMSDF